MKKRVLALAVALVLCVGLLPGGVWAAEAAPAVRVSFTAQAAGGFLCAPQLDVEVSGSLAEDYGYTDSVTDGVSVLDVLVRAHEVVLGDAFTPETASTVLAVGDGGWITTLFGTETSASGFILNGMYAHDGTESEYGGYNGTTVTTQRVVDGDQVDFFIYQDISYWTDMLTWLRRDGQVVDALTVMPGEQVELALEGYSYMGCYNFVDADALHAYERVQDIDAAQMAWVDVSSGAVTDIEGAVTTEGAVTVTMPTEPGTYYLTSYMPEEEIVEWAATPLVMMLTPVTVTAPDASFTVPSDATLFVGSKSKHFVPFAEIAPASQVEDGGMTTYTFDLKTGSTYNFRVSGEGYVTYGGTFKKTDGFEKTVTREDLMPEGKTRTTVERDVTANSGYNVADIYLNINSQGYLTMDSGETYQLVNLRNWEAVNTVSANYFIEPDYHYTVVDETGAPSGVVTVSSDGLVTANEAGTAIVLVTYDAMQVECAAGGPFFGAIWPENTGVFVVSVDAQESGIETGMTLNAGKNTVADASKLSLDALDGELDVIYFIGETGSYTFTPKTAGCAVAVANPAVGETMTFTGFTSVEANADGSVTVPLTQGRNIVKLTKDGKSTYQVVTAKQVTVSGVPEAATPGQELAITFDTLYHPANKLAGVYNMDAVAVYSGVDGYEGQLVGGTGNRHKFASTPEAQTVDGVLVRGTDQWGGLAYTKKAPLTIPADWKEDTFTLSGGALVAYGYGDPFGNHRGITLTEGKAPNLNAAVKEAYLGQLPDIVIPVKQETENPPTPPVLSNITVKFTLLGDEHHDSDTDKQVHTRKAGNLTTWLEETSVTVDKGATVFDVIDKALTDAGISYEEDGSENGYISAVNGLGETDNGENSGWMYTLNGKYPDKGIKKQTVKNGDKIVLHYTDDYTVEKTDISPEKPTDPSRPSASTGTGTAPKTDETDEKPVEFEDVPAEHWAHDAVAFVVDRGLFLGTGDGKFSPELAMSRGMVATVLYRLKDGKASESAGFPDVEEGSWYADGVNWAYSAGLVTGDGVGFAPHRAVTRQELAVMLYRLAKEDIKAAKTADLTAFEDGNTVADWASDAMTWAVGTGLLQGKTGSVLDPAGVATRGEVATMFERLVRLLTK